MDRTYMDEWEKPRLGPGIVAECLKASYRAVCDHEIELTEFGKPYQFSYDFVEERL